MLWTNGRYMLKCSTIEKMTRNTAWLKLKLRSSLCMPTHYKNVLTTASITSKQWGFPTYSETLKGAPTYPTVPAILHIAANTSTSMGTECHSEERAMSLPGHADKLLALGGCYDCAFEWCCLPHNICFIHDSCLCNGSSSFPPVKPPRDWSWFSCEWYIEFALLCI